MEVWGCKKLDLGIEGLLGDQTDGNRGHDEKMLFLSDHVLSTFQEYLSLTSC